VTTITEKKSWKEKITLLKDVMLFRPQMIIGLVILGLFVAFFEALGLSFIQPIFDIASEGGEIQEGRVTEIFSSFYSFLGINFNLRNLILGVSFAIILRYTSTFLLRWYKTALSKGYEIYLKKNCFSLATNTNISYWDKKGADKIIHHILGDTSKSSNLISTLIGVMERSILVIIYILVMAYVSLYLTIITVFILALIAFLLRYVLEPAVAISSRSADANEKVSEKVQSGIKGLKEIKLFGLRNKFNSDLQNSLEKYLSNEITISRNENAIQSLYKMSAALTVFLLIYSGIEYTNLSLGNLGLFLLALYRLSGTISSLNSRIYRLEGKMSNYIRVKEFVEEISNNQESFEGVEIDEIENISLENVSFSYDEEEALNDVSLEIGKGEFVGLAGKSGAGKSTVVSLLSRMYKPDSGKIVSGNEDIDQISLSSWRDKLAVVQQQCYIFNTTLRKNIKIGDLEANEHEVKRICELAEVKEFLKDLPNGLDTKIGENGVKLSGGQRQRVAIARALIKKPEILILDEATSDLDSDLENKIHKNISRMEENHGVLAVAHRLSTLTKANRIYTMEKGKITEKGSHKDLIESGGIYSELYKIQNSE